MEKNSRRVQLSERRAETLQKAYDAFVGISNVSAGRTGDEFFQSLVARIAESLQISCVCAAELVEDSDHLVETTAMWMDGQLSPNICYDLRDTPCANVIGKQACVYPTGVQEQFPRDPMLVEFGFDSYIGVPLFDASGAALGLLAGLDRKPLNDPELPAILFQMFAAHAAGELERRRAQLARERSEDRLRLAFEAARMDAWEWDLVSGRSRLSNIAQNFLGDSLPKMPEKMPETLDAFLTIVHKADRERVAAAMRNAIAGGTDYRTEFRLVRNDGETLWIAVRGRVHFDSAGQPTRILGVTLDIDDLKRATEESRRLELRIQQSQKLEMLGVLAGGVAHDFNNLLQVVLSHATVASETPEIPELVRSSLEQIELAAQRAGELTHQLLAFAGRVQISIQPIDLSELALEMSLLLDSSLSRRATIERNFAPSLPHVDGDPTQLRQILLNLILNAAEALPETGGVIRLTTGVAEYTAQELAALPPGGNLPRGRYVYLDVADTGCGITDETRLRMFDPFFTTKTGGRGLGLAAVLGIVKGHQGAIQVDSVQERGTRIRVLLPVSRTEAAADGAAPTRAVPKVSLKSHGTILIVDDEGGVRSSTRMLLEAMGYRALTASDGLEALEKYRAATEPIVAVLLDMSMPRMDGLEAFRQLRELNPRLPVVFSSGLTGKDASRELAHAPAAVFLPKPYRAHDLARALERVLKEQEGQ